MDIDKLIRNPQAILGHLMVTKDDRLVTRKKLTVCIPALYEQQQLMEITDEVYALGIFAIIDEDGNYAVNKCLAKFPLTPLETYREKINDEEYLFLTFEPGSTVLRNVNVMKDDTLTYYVYNYFIARGYVPWFISYEDILTLYSSSAKYAGVKLGSSSSVTEMIGSAIARNPKEGHLMFRTGLKSVEEGNKQKPFWVPLTNVQFGAADTTSKLLGSYFDDGLNSAIANPSKKINPIEEVLRA